MARRLRQSRFETCTARLTKLPVSKKPHTVHSLAPGVALLYRRNKRSGTWVVKVLAGSDTYWTKSVADLSAVPAHLLDPASAFLFVGNRKTRLSRMGLIPASALPKPSSATAARAEVQPVIAGTGHLSTQEAADGLNRRDITKSSGK